MQFSSATAFQSSILNPPHTQIKRRLHGWAEWKFTFRFNCSGTGFLIKVLSSLTSPEEIWMKSYWEMISMLPLSQLGFSDWNNQFWFQTELQCQSLHCLCRQLNKQSKEALAQCTAQNWSKVTASYCLQWGKIHGRFPGLWIFPLALFQIMEYQGGCMENHNGFVKKCCGFLWYYLPMAILYLTASYGWWLFQMVSIVSVYQCLAFILSWYFLKIFHIE